MIFFSIFWTAYIPLAMLLITLVSALTTRPRDMRAAQHSHAERLRRDR
jgi:hypothetical protein